MKDNPGAVLVDEATDAGVSGWKGKHLGPEGELGRLVAAIEAGDYPAGTHLLVETVDRLGRLDFLGMMEPLGKILRGGVTVVLLETGQRYDREALNGPGMHAFAAAIQTAYAFSERLSRRVQAAWDERKEAGAEGRAVGNRRLPLWLDRVGDDAVLNEPMAAFVAECLELYCSGLGYRKAMKLARERHPHVAEWEATRSYGKRSEGAKLKDAWLQHLIEKPASVDLLRGFWNGVECYPAPIPLDLWHRVKQERRRRLEGSTRAVPSRTHFLTSVAVCGVCGGAMNLKPARDKRVLFCGNKNRGGDCTNGKGVPEAVGVALYRAEAGPWIERALATRQTTPGMRRIIAIDHELGEISEGVARLADALLTYDRQEFRTRMDALLAQQKALESERTQLQADEDQALSQLANTIDAGWQDSEHPSETLELGGLLRKVGFEMTCYPDGKLTIGGREYQSLGWSRTEGTYLVEERLSEESSMSEYRGRTEAEDALRRICIRVDN
jgi:DNA invertase Pin-like site-specific DNA recombinase